MKTIICLTLLFFLLIFQIQNISATTFTVTNTNDNGTGTLREALTNASYYPGTGHHVEFNIPASDPGYNATLGVWVIKPASTLPYIIKSGTVIDGTSQTTNQGNTNLLGPEIMLDGNNNAIDFGFFVSNAPNVIIKGFIVSSFLYGIQIFGSLSQQCLVTGNYLGTNATAGDSLGNFVGVEIFGGAKFNTVGGLDSTLRNVVSGNEHIGIRVFDASDNIIIGNFVGTDRTGNYAIGNRDGVSIEGTARRNIVGGTQTGSRNIISGNVAYGVPIFGAGCDSNIVIGNYIGTNHSGTSAIPNTYGLLYDDGARYNTLGGYLPEERNILSGNSGYGVFLYNMGTAYNKVIGNFIGTDVSGTVAIPNANGIVVDGAAVNHLIDKNIISGNLQQGIVIHITGCDNHVIARNYIGTDLTGINPLPNGLDGIRIAEGPKYNTIGGSEQNANIIAFNGANGVQIMNEQDDFNTISYNSIHSNTALGIEIFPPGPNQNDAGDIDSGPNQGMNYPVITLAEYTVWENYLTINGTLDTQLPQFCKVELFKSENDVSGYGEGKTYIGYANVDATGNWYYQGFGGAITGDKITATATDSSGNTSEFSLNYMVTEFVGINKYSVTNEMISVFPNPFKKEVSINYTGKENSFAEIAVYSLKGEKIKVLFHGKTTQKNTTIVWNGSDENENIVAAGNYLIRYILDGAIITTVPVIFEK